MKDCELCTRAGGTLLWRDAFCRVVRVREAHFSDYPGLCRVVLQRHVSEMSELPAPERERLMRVVFACEQAVRLLFRPDKVNLASLGNVVPHLHWHVVPRHRDDRHYPDPIWAAPRRGARSTARAVSDPEFRGALRAALT